MVHTQAPPIVSLESGAYTQEQPVHDFRDPDEGWNGDNVPHKPPTTRRCLPEFREREGAGTDTAFGIRDVEPRQSVGATDARGCFCVSGQIVKASPGPDPSIEIHLLPA